MKLVDTSFLIDLSKNLPEAVKKSFELDNEAKVFCTEVSVYEIILGIYAIKNINYSNKIQKLEMMFKNFHILGLDHSSAVKAGEISGMLAREGKTISDADCMIVGIALANGINTIVTRDREHFQRIKGIVVEGY